MNLFNRLVVSLLAALALAAGAFVLAVSGGWASAESLAPAPALARLADWLRQGSGFDPLWMTAGALLAVILGALLLWLEGRPARRERLLVLRRDKLGSVTVSVTGLRRLADHVVLELPGVEQVVSEARPTREGVSFRCRLHVTPETSAPDLATRAQEQLSAAVLAHTGLHAAPIDIHTQIGGTAVKRRVR